MALVFQYGSNTSSMRFNSHDRLCGDAKDLGLVRTQAMFELDFDVWSTTNKCAAADIRHGTGPSYERRPIRVQTPNGTLVDDAIAYTVREPRQGLQTSLAYVSHILAGLREHSAPDEYVAYVKKRVIANSPGLAGDLERL